MLIRSNQVLYYLLDKWRGNVAGLSFDGSRISASGSRKPPRMLSEILEVPTIRQKWIGDELSVGVASESGRLRVRSCSRKRLTRFSSDLEQAWREYSIKQMRACSDVIERVLASLRELENPTRYPAACLVQPALAEAQELEAQHFSKLNMDAIGKDHCQDIAAIRTFIADPQKLRTEAITKFERKQLDQWADFFDSFETNPLTPEQRLRSYGAAMKVIGNIRKQKIGRWKNNRAENSHLPFRRRARAMLRFRRMRSLQKLASVHSSIHNHFNQERHFYRRHNFKLNRTAALSEWRLLCSA